MFGGSSSNQSNLFGGGQQSSSFGTTSGILGGNKSSAFGQISQPNTLFGQQPQQQGGGGLFGSTSVTPAFGATTTAASSIFGGFGQQQQQPGQPGGLFGVNKPSAPSFSSFGGTQQPFGSSTTTNSIFGPSIAAPKLGTGGIFGGQQTQQQPSIGGGGVGLFGSNNTSLQKPTLPSFATNTQSSGGGLFGSVKFSPITGNDTMQLKGSQTQVSTKQMCISAMKEFDTKSLEEIRFNDYVGGKKVNTSIAPSFGQQQQAGLFGFTSSKPSGLFSTSTTTTTTNSLFGGSTLPSSTANLFTGTKPTMFGSSSNQSNLFGGGQQQSSSTTGFGTTSGILGGNKSSPFGQISQPNPLFGQQPQQQGGGGLFGPNSVTPSFGPTTTAASSIFGGFGQQQQQPGQPGGLFGVNKPSAPSFSSFGGTQQPFGSSTTTNSIFGPSTAAPKLGTGGIFGGQQTQQQSSIGGGGGLFGSNITTSLQKPILPSFATNNTQSSGGGLFGSATIQPMSFGTNINISNFENSIITAQLSALPYGDSPFLKITTPRKTVDDFASLQKQLKFDNNQKSTNQFLSDISVVSTISKIGQNITNQTLEENNTIIDGSFTYKPIIILPSVGFGAALGLHYSPKLTKSFTNEKSFNSEKSTKSLDMSVVFDSNNNNNNEENSFIDENQPNNSTIHLQLSSPPLETDHSVIQEIQSPPPPNKIQQEEENIQQQQNLKNISPPIIQQKQQQEEKILKIKLTRPEYYTQPKIEDLENLFNSFGILKIEGGLTIGRLGYGSVFWKGPIELQKPINLDEIIYFRNKEVILYPDENKKPTIGLELNKQAEVSLENVWPIDPKTKIPIKDADELRKMNFRGKLERLCIRMDSIFIDYQPATGTWVFEVEHFSKYGFLEDDEEEEPQNDNNNNNTNLIQSSFSLNLQNHHHHLVQKSKIPLREIQKTKEVVGEGSQKRDYNNSINNNNIIIDNDSKIFQEEIICKKLRFDDTLFDSSKLLNIITNKEDNQQQQKIDIQKKLIERLPKFNFEGLSLQMIKNSILIKSGGINFQFPSCKIGFTQGLNFASILPSNHLNIVNIYQANVILPTVKDYFMHYIRNNNNNLNQQQNNIQNLENSQLIKFDPPSTLLCLLEEYLTNSYESGVVENIDQNFNKICELLLMNINTIEDKIFQRIQMGEWLYQQLHNNNYINKNKQQQKKPFLTIFNFLINGNVVKAAEYAREKKLFNMAMLLSVYRSPSISLVRTLVSKQLASARKQKNTDCDYLKILQLLSGEFKNVYDLTIGLNWLQILGILIWYHSSPSTTLLECLDILQELI